LPFVVIVQATPSGPRNEGLVWFWLPQLAVDSLIFQKDKARRGAKVLLWHRSRFAARYAALNAEPS
jgi:hypothetical protein